MSGSHSICFFAGWEVEKARLNEALAKVPHLIPYLAADYACYAFQVAEYAKHFTCISIDLRGTGESDKPEGVYSTELFADDVAAFMQAVGIPSAHISGLSLGAASGMWLAAKYPNRVKSLSLHSAWGKA